MIAIEPQPGAQATSDVPAVGDRRSTSSPMRGFGVATPTLDSASDQGLPAVSPLLPLLVISLPDRSVRGSNRVAAEFFGVSQQELLHRTLNDVIDHTEAAMIGQALSALGSGAIDSYRAHRTLETERGPAAGIVWVRSIPRTSGGMALVLVLPAEEGDDLSQSSLSSSSLSSSSLSRDSASHPAFDLATGTMDSTGRIITLSRSDSGVLVDPVAGSAPAPLLANHVHPDDRERFQAALDHLEHEIEDVIVPVRLDHAQHEWIAGECHLFGTGDDATGEPIGFVLSELPPQPSAPSAARIAELEQHIDRIAAEVRAAGVTMGSSSHMGDLSAAGLGALTPRQRDIVNRLLDGARVSTIAAALFISPSTVRNHLSVVYKMAHVHSQAELIELLRPTG